MNSDLDNSSIKSETLSNASNTDQQSKMTIGDQKPEQTSLANLLSANMLDSSTSKLNSGLIFQMINQLNSQTTGEQPLDLSLNPRKDFDLSDLSFLSALHSDADSLAGKIKK